MAAFLRTYWAWIVLPFVLVVLGFALFLWLTRDAQPSTDFVYPLF
jgi:hypothetical protein